MNPPSEKALAAAIEIENGYASSSNRINFIRHIIDKHFAEQQAEILRLNLALEKEVGDGAMAEHLICEERDQLAARLAETEKVLKELEWSGNVNTSEFQVSSCPCCNGWSPNSGDVQFWIGRDSRRGHTETCQLLKLLTSTPANEVKRVEEKCTCGEPHISEFVVHCYDGKPCYLKPTTH